MLMAPVIDGPPWGYCSCGWPLLPDGSCSNGDCVDMGLDDDLDDCPEQDDDWEGW
jgi:hypothetical protein